MMARTKQDYEQFLSNGNVVAYLNAISAIEAPTYYTNFGGGIIVPTSDKHPEVKVCKGKCSTAFGRYQFMPDTWEAIVASIGPLDIRKPRDQDIAAMWLLDQKRGTFDDVVNGNCMATLDENSYEWAAMPSKSSGFRYSDQGSDYDAKGFCKLVESLKGTTLPEGPLITNAATIASAGTSSAASPSNSPYSSGNFSDVTCPPIKEEDLYRANFQITNPGCKVSGPVQSVTGSSTNGGTVKNSSPTNTNASFSVNSQGFGQCSTLRSPCNMSEVVVTSGFGWRWGRNHNGIDLAAPIGTPIYAASNGKVDYAGWEDSGFGNLVIIISPDNIETKYAHLEVIKCSVGQEVKIGQQIGGMGSTGKSTGSHLHFEIRINGSDAIDPESCIKFR